MARTGQRVQRLPIPASAFSARRIRALQWVGLALGLQTSRCARADGFKTVCRAGSTRGDEVQLIWPILRYGVTLCNGDQHAAVFWTVPPKSQSRAGFRNVRYRCCRPYRPTRWAACRMAAALTGRFPRWAGHARCEINGPVVQQAFYAEIHDTNVPCWPNPPPNEIRWPSPLNKRSPAA